MAAPLFAVQVRIADEVQCCLNTASWLRTALENELNAAFGVGKNGEPPKTGIDGKSVQKFRDVVKAVEALADTHIRLQKNAKQMAEQMTPDEELEAVRAYIRSLEKSVATKLLTEELKWQDSRK